MEGNVTVIQDIHVRVNRAKISELLPEHRFDTDFLLSMQYSLPFLQLCVAGIFRVNMYFNTYSYL